MEFNYLKNKDELIRLLEEGKTNIERLKFVVGNWNDESLSTIMHKRQVEGLLSLDYNSLLKVIDIEKKEISELNENTLKDCGDQYKTYYINRLERIYNNLNTFNKLNIESILENSLIVPIYDTINNLNNLLKRDSIYELYEHFKYDRKNYILFGKNGAGKTTLLNKISREVLKSNTVVLSATRNIFYSNKDYVSNSELELSSILSENGKTLFLLGKLLTIRDYHELKEGVDKEETILKKAELLFNQLGVNRKLLIDEKGNMSFEDDNCQSYLISSASDGERSALYIMLAVLLSPKNAFVFIDEPENHLNGALMRKLFDSLENERPDVRFVFATHNIPFIQSRENFELIYIEKIDGRNNWKFKDISNCKKELSLDIVFNIEGTNDDIIFCEGDDINSLDYKIYNLLFPNYQIMPANGCENVEVQTQLVNKFASTFKKKSKGIVDGDFRFSDDIDKLKEKEVFVLPVNEIENICFLPCCLNAFLNFAKDDKTIDEVKKLIIKKIEIKTNEIKKDFATKLLRKIQMKNKFKSVDNIDECLTLLISENKEKFMTEYSKFENELDTNISNKDYDKLMKTVPGKIIINDVAQIMGVQRDFYLRNLLSLINSDSDLKRELLGLIKID